MTTSSALILLRRLPNHPPLSDASGLNLRGAAPKLLRCGQAQMQTVSKTLAAHWEWKSFGWMSFMAVDINILSPGNVVCDSNSIRDSEEIVKTALNHALQSTAPAPPSASHCQTGEKDGGQVPLLDKNRQTCKGVLRRKWESLVSLGELAEASSRGSDQK
nr:hypothetical protein Iba_chr10bCG3480 [Ipomoea batatas]